MGRFVSSTGKRSQNQQGLWQRGAERHVSPPARPGPRRTRLCPQLSPPERIPDVQPPEWTLAWQPSETSTNPGLDFCLMSFQNEDPKVENMLLPHQTGTPLRPAHRAAPGRPPSGQAETVAPSSVSASREGLSPKPRPRARPQRITQEARRLPVANQMMSAPSGRASSPNTRVAGGPVTGCTLTPGTGTKQSPKNLSLQRRRPLPGACH